MHDPAPEVSDLLAHRDHLARLARSLARDESAAEDLVQDTWLAALRHPPRHGASPRGWLAAVLRRTFVDRRASERGRARRERRAREDAAGTSEPPEEALAARQVREALAAAIEALPPHYAEAIHLRFEEGLPPREIGRRLGVPAETARTRVKRALALLRADLDRRTGDRRAWLGGLALLIPRREPPRAAAVVPAVAGTLAAAVALWLVASPRGVATPEAARPSRPTPEADARVAAAGVPAPRRPAGPGTPAPVQETARAERESALLAGAVLDADGRPQPDAALLLLAPGAEAPRTVGRTDGTGRFELEVPRGGWLGARRGLWYSRLAWLDGPGWTTSANLRLRTRAQPVSGVVYGPDGHPVAGAKVRWTPDHPFPWTSSWGPNGRRWRPPLAAAATTEEDGGFRLHRLGRRPRRLVARTATAGWSGLAEDGAAIVLEEGWSPTGTTPLRRPQPGIWIGVVGVLEDEDGAPLHGAWVGIDRGDGVPWEEASEAGGSARPVDGEGAFSLLSSGGNESLHLWLPGEAPRVLASWTDFRERRDLGTLRVGSAGDLRVRVRTGDAPPESFSIAVDPGGPRVRTAQSDRPAHGIAFRGDTALVRDLPPGTWPVVVKAPGFMRERREVVIEAGTRSELEVSLERGVLVEVEVDLVDPVRGRVELEVLDDAGRRVALEEITALGGEHGPNLWSIVLAPGAYRLEARVSPSLRVGTRLEVGEQPTRARLELR